MRAPDGFKQPSHWPKWVRAAYLEITDEDDELILHDIQRDLKTLKRWRADADFWPVAVEQAEHLFAETMTRQARKTALQAVAGARMPNSQVNMTKFALERRDPRFRPPQKAEKDTVAPVVLGDVPSGVMREPNPEGTLDPDMDPNDLFDKPDFLR